MPSYTSCRYQESSEIPAGFIRRTILGDTSFTLPNPVAKLSNDTPLRTKGV